MQDMAKVKRSPAAEAIASRMISEYSPESVEDMQNALGDIFGPMFEGLPKENPIIIRDMNPIQGKGGVHPT